jgi:hypothetical protein
MYEANNSSLACYHCNAASNTPISLLPRRLGQVCRLDSQQPPPIATPHQTSCQRADEDPVGRASAIVDLGGDVQRVDVLDLFVPTMVRSNGVVNSLHPIKCCCSTHQYIDEAGGLLLLDDLTCTSHHLPASVCQCGIQHTCLCLHAHLLARLLAIAVGDHADSSNQIKSNQIKSNQIKSLHISFNNNDQDTKREREREKARRG